MFFKCGSAEPKGSANGIQGFRRLPVLCKKIKLHATFAVTRCVF